MRKVVAWCGMLKLARLGDGPEIFHTLQGEGLSTGRPCVFVRVSLCNLHCVWCDTDYTWNWEGTSFRHERDGEPGYRKFRRDEEILAVEAVEAAKMVHRFPSRRVVLTGGEPMMQQDALGELCRELRLLSEDYTFEVETNGTLAAEPEFDAWIEQYNVSPKLANSGNTRGQREKPEILRAYAAGGKAWFKFVVAAAADLEEIQSMEEAAGLPRDRILLMPEGRTPEAQEASRAMVAGLCLQQGYRFTDRLHLRLYGARRGT